MSFAATLATALRALRANALRTILAMLGIIIGVAAVIVMVSISQGAGREIDRFINTLGTNLITITPRSVDDGPRQGGEEGRIPFTDRDVESLRDRVDGVRAVSGMLRGRSTVVGIGVNWPTSLVGTDEAYLEVRDWPLIEGRNITASDVRAGAKVALVGQTVATELFGGATPIDAAIRVDGVPFRIVGLLGEKGQSSWGTDNDDVLIVPITTARSRLLGGHEIVPNPVDTVLAEALDGLPQGYVEDRIADVLRDRRGVPPGGQDDFRVRNLTELISARTQTQRTLGILLAATAGVALIVGGIGIMNIMLVSVTERTREIGLRIAVGARPSDIRAQFLVEAICLCGIGGAIGVALGAAGSLGVASAAGWPGTIDLPVVVLALAASAGIGVLFGFFPAQRAAGLNPIDALRHE